MKKYEITVYSVEKDGLPKKTDDDSMSGRLAFIWDGAIISGWPADPDENGDILWEASEDALGGPYYGVTHWIELPVPAWNLE